VARAGASGGAEEMNCERAGGDSASESGARRQEQSETKRYDTKTGYDTHTLGHSRAKQRAKRDRRIAAPTLWRARTNMRRREARRGERRRKRAEVSKAW